MKYAVIKTGGKQYKVEEGDVLEVERLQILPNKDFNFEEVLLYVSDDSFKIGKPKAEGVKVLAKLLEHIKGEKIRVSKFKSKVKYRRTTGHRQSLSKVKIESIGLHK
ncbi:MAG: 50S ribosomal protein L21 [Candidatus Levyibacteriota bacterium]